MNKLKHTVLVVTIQQPLFTIDVSQGQATRDSPALDGRSGSDIIQEEQRRQAAQEEAAAVKIQAGFRGYQVRQDMKQKQAERSSGRDSSLLRDDPIPIQGEDDWGALQNRERYVCV